VSAPVEPPEPPKPDRAAAGWYADPLGVGKHRYWDGESWTNQTVRPNPMTRGRLTGPEIVIGIAGLALAASPFLVWAHVLIFGSYNLFQLLTADGSSHALAWILVLAGAGTAVVAFFVKTDTRIVAIAVGLIAGAIALLKAIHLLHEVRAAKGTASMGYGPWIAVIACAAMIVAGFLETHSGSDGASALPPPV
jgi:hypothetical protein